MAEAKSNFKCTTNQAFIFIKPHAAIDACVENVKKVVDEKLKAAGIAINGEPIVIDSKRIDSEQLIDTHYYAIARYQRQKLMLAIFEHTQSPQSTIFHYFLSWVISVSADTISQLLISQQLWAAISCLDSLWYSSFYVAALKQPFNPVEFAPLLVVIAGIYLSSQFGPEPYEGDIVGLARVEEEHSLIQVLAFTIPFFAILAGAYYYLYLIYVAQHLNSRYSTGGKDDHELPKPLTIYTMVGIFANGASSAIYFTISNICINTFFNFDSDQSLLGFILLSVVAIPIIFLSFGTDMFVADHLHALTVVPSSLIVNTICQFIFAEVLYEDVYVNLGVFLAGIFIMVIGLISYVVAHEYYWVEEIAQGTFLLEIASVPTDSESKTETSSVETNSNDTDIIYTDSSSDTPNTVTSNSSTSSSDTPNTATGSASTASMDTYTADTSDNTTDQSEDYSKA